MLGTLAQTGLSHSPPRLHEPRLARAKPSRSPIGATLVRASRRSDGRRVRLRLVVSRRSVLRHRRRTALQSRASVRGAPSARRLPTPADPVDSDEVPRALDLHRPLALHLVAPVRLVLRLDPGSPAGQVTARAPLRDNALQFMLAHGRPQSFDASKAWPRRKRRPAGAGPSRSCRNERRCLLVSGCGSVVPTPGRRTRRLPSRSGRTHHRSSGSAVRRQVRYSRSADARGKGLDALRLHPVGQPCLPLR